MNNEAEIVHKLEAKFPFLTHIIFEKLEPDGTYWFTCIDIDVDADLQVSKEGWVTSRKYYSKYWDVLGQI